MSGPASWRRWQVPRLDRDDRWVGGVAAAVAREIGVQPIVIRAAFVVLASVGGWGLVLYAVSWLVLAIANPRQLSPYSPEPKAATPAHRVAAVVMITVGLVMAFLQLSDAVFSAVVWPIGFVLSGMLIAWTRSEDGGTSAVVRVVAGLVFAIGGFLAFTATQVDLVDGAIAFVFGLSIVSGIVLVAAPSVVRMGRDLDRERQERVRADERARIGAHIHDSVLQTLTLIQQHGDDSVRTRQLARRQERELRSWLYGASATEVAGRRLRPALEFTASDVETEFDVVIDVVAVGDTDDLEAANIEPLIAASREAMINAAKHSGVGRISVYAERRNGVVEVFVRDEGRGFDQHGVGGDRRGLAESIVGRMTRAGGAAVVHSAVGSGTEVELSLPIGVLEHES
jgi:signal transduction histidine kinase